MIINYCIGRDSADVRESGSNLPSSAHDGLQRLHASLLLRRVSELDRCSERRPQSQLCPYSPQLPVGLLCYYYINCYFVKK